MKVSFSVAVALVALGLASGCSPAKPVVDAVASSATSAEITLPPTSQRDGEITVAPATLRSMPIFVRTVGGLALNERKTEHIGVVFPGTVIKIFADVGDHVETGQVLALMHSHDLHDAVAAYQSAQAESDRTSRQLVLTRTMRDRYRKLYEIQYASREETERSELQFQSARADSAKAGAMLRAARAHLAGMLQLPERGLKEISLDIDALPIKTPRAGVVIKRMVTPGMALQPGSETFTVSDLSSLWMVASVNESDIHAIKVGRRATVRVRAYPNAVFDGWVEQLGPTLDPTTRTLSVRVVVPNDTGLLRPDMFATAEIDAGGSRNGIFVREAAVQDMNGNPVVFVRRGDAVFEVRSIELGEHRDGLVQIIAGVHVGEMIVDHGAFVVKSQFLARALSQD